MKKVATIIIASLSLFSCHKKKNDPTPSQSSIAPISPIAPVPQWKVMAISTQRQYYYGDYMYASFKGNNGSGKDIYTFTWNGSTPNIPKGWTQDIKIWWVNNVPQSDIAVFSEPLGVGNGWEFYIPYFKNDFAGGTELMFY